MRTVVLDVILELWLCRREQSKKGARDLGDKEGKGSDRTSTTASQRSHAPVLKEKGDHVRRRRRGQNRLLVWPRAVVAYKRATESLALHSRGLTPTTPYRPSLSRQSMSGGEPVVRSRMFLIL